MMQLSNYYSDLKHCTIDIYFMALVILYYYVSYVILLQSFDENPTILKIT